jgi:hypothetical protein
MFKNAYFDIGMCWVQAIILDQENVIIGEVSQTEKDKSHVISQLRKEEGVNKVKGFMGANIPSGNQVLMFYTTGG